MGQEWVQVRVELRSGWGVDLAPAPGRVLAIPPDTRFHELAIAIDVAFGRWELPVDQRFRRSSGELIDGMARVTRVLGQQGSSVSYELGSGRTAWLHECICEGAVQGDLISRPEVPIVLLGWGSIPDPNFLETDPRLPALEEGTAASGSTASNTTAADTTAPTTSEVDTPTANGLATPAAPPAEERAEDPTVDSSHGLVLAEQHHSRRQGKPGPLDMRAVRVAAAVGDAEGLLDAIEDRDIATVLQQVGGALLALHRSEARSDRLDRALAQIGQLLSERAWEGDDLLAEDIETTLAGEIRRGRTLAINLEELGDVMAQGGEDPGGYFHLDTGEVVPAFVRHDEAFEDVETGADAREDDDLWVYVDHTGDDWADMAAFAAVARPEHTGILEVAIHGKGAFRRFRSTVDDLDIAHEWLAFRDDRRQGRARALLKRLGVRPI